MRASTKCDSRLELRPRVHPAHQQATPHCRVGQVLGERGGGHGRLLSQVTGGLEDDAQGARTPGP